MTPELDKDNQVTFGDLIKILRKQLQLLSEYSEKGCPDELANLTDSMVRLVTLLREIGSNRT